MSADGVIPTAAERARVFEVGRVIGMDGRPVVVGVNGHAVTIRADGGVTLNGSRCDTLAQLYVRAVWLAACNPEPA